ncbi:glycine zipper 2TM domain-containing protein [Chromobacterium sp. IIBBL 290-4]|uniref:glycine zipper 2TM domain-containing protein n=1 Tax=Chromobacterium sp. IIBBL 290-4 TaxID=2953890 RepID=UPI0020B888C7|nr:glycine zipper 2TM domain-containing protein [Chromobacterium sp. IIBBL 290-4]UTH74424.1 glycine zipper 2TM domain-containing protein [Chromobacterium sp. IIBBL 290-4]
MTHTIQRPARLLLAGAMALSLLSGCASMSHRQQNTAVGAAAGAVLGSVLTGGSAVATLGGAAIGGVIGHQTGHR